MVKYWRKVVEVWVNISLDKQDFTTIGRREYIVLFTHKNVAETTTIMSLFAHAGLSVCKGWNQDVSVRTYASM